MLCGGVVAPLVLIVVACLASLRGKTSQMWKLVMCIGTLTWWEMLGRIGFSDHSIGRLPVVWSIRGNITVQLYCLLASLSLI